MSKLSKKDPNFYSKISKLRKHKSGGKYFQKDPEAAARAGRKGGKKSRRMRLDDRVMTEYLDDLDV